MTNNDFAQHINRRTFLGRGATGLGMVALNSLINPRLLAAAQAVNMTSKGAVNPLDFPPKAKRVIFLGNSGFVVGRRSPARAGCDNFGDARP